VAQTRNLTDHVLINYARAGVPRGAASGLMVLESHRPSRNQGGTLPPPARLEEPCRGKLRSYYIRARAGETRLCRHPLWVV
jgi:hypothetical protein